jgi:DNA (cytosine-5)-methyltransferase 1
MRGAYYNEIDPYAAAWLRNLIAAGHIAAGDVDERSIEDVRPDDLRGYTQCHFFAGIGIWSYALRLAGVPDTERVWTGSCPCQPFSQAGKGAGLADERHLWPAWFHLIEQCRPPVVLGEQVASKDAEPWLDAVSLDLEAVGFAFGALAFPSAGIGAPHIRDRTYFVADADDAGSQGRFGVRQRATQRPAWARGVVDGLDHASSVGPEARQRRNHAGHDGIEPPAAGSIRGLADAARLGERADQSGRDSRDRQQLAWPESRRDGGDNGAARELADGGPVNGYWRAADWLLCRDQKWRPVEPGAFPLVDGAPARVGRLRAYGNAINAQAAAEFIRATGFGDAEAWETIEEGAIT